MSFRHAFGVACMFAVLAGSLALVIAITWYLLITSPPLGVALIVFVLLLVGAVWGLE